MRHCRIIDKVPVIKCDVIAKCFNWIAPSWCMAACRAIISACMPSVGCTEHKKWDKTGEGWSVHVNNLCNINLLRREVRQLQCTVKHCYRKPWDRSGALNLLVINFTPKLKRFYKTKHISVMVTWSVIWISGDPQQMQLLEMYSRSA